MASDWRNANLKDWPILRFTSFMAGTWRDQTKKFSGEMRGVLGFCKKAAQMSWSNIFECQMPQWYFLQLEVLIKNLGLLIVTANRLLLQSIIMSQDYERWFGFLFFHLKSKSPSSKNKILDMIGPKVFHSERPFWKVGERSRPFWERRSGRRSWITSTTAHPQPCVEKPARWTINQRSIDVLNDLKTPTDGSNSSKLFNSNWFKPTSKFETSKSSPNK